MPHEQSFEAHKVPPPIGKAVAAVQRTRGTKRPLPPAAATAPQAPIPAIGAGAGGKARREERGEPLRVFHAGCPMFEIDISGKTPVMVLNEFCPKVRP